MDIHNSDLMNMTVHHHHSHLRTTISLDGISTFRVFTVTLILFAHSHVTVVLNNFSEAEEGLELPLQDAEPCIEKYKQHSSNKTFLCPHSSPKSSHRLEVWGLQHDQLTTVSIIHTNLTCSLSLSDTKIQLDQTVYTCTNTSRHPKFEREQRSKLKPI